MSPFVQCVRPPGGVGTRPGRIVVRIERSCVIAYDPTQGTVATAAPGDPLAQRWLAQAGARIINYGACLSASPSPRLAYPLSLRVILNPPVNGESQSAHQPRLNAKKIGQLVKNFADDGGIQIVFVGKGAIAHPDVAALIAQARGQGLLTVLESEAVNAEVNIPSIKTASPSEVRIVVFGGQAEHDRRRGVGSYQRSISLVKGLAHAGVVVKLVLAVDGANIPSWLEVAAQAERIGCRSGFIPRDRRAAGGLAQRFPARYKALVTGLARWQRVLPRSSPPEVLYGFLLAPPRLDCPTRHLTFGCGQIEMLVTARGDCYSCEKLKGLKPFLMGNCLRNSIAGIWGSGKRCPDVFVSVPKDCVTCSYRCLPCTGGCAVERNGKTTRQLTRDPLCFR